MNPKRLYTYLYKLLENVTPINADCGRLCGSACCKGDEDTGMYLFPYEEVMYNGTEDWLKIYDSDFVINNKPVKIAICSGSCDRKKRPLSCRIFPLFQLNGAISTDLRANQLCPLAYGKIRLDEYDARFVENVTKVFNILSKFKITNEYVKETEKLILQYKFI